MKALRRAKVALMYAEYELRKAIGGHNQRPNLAYYRIRNWGDILNPYLMEAISGRNFVKIDLDMRNVYLKSSVRYLEEREYLCIGSIMHHANKNTVVWGSGLIDGEKKVYAKPLEVHAVRGPLTRSAINKQGIDCPEIYGDPALCLPRYFPNTQQKLYRLGLILHNDHVGQDFMGAALEKEKDVLVISLRDGFKQVLHKIQQCEHIVSSSLHGLIVADAYGIPSLRLVTDKALYGKDFKFNDYYESIGALDPPVLKAGKTANTDKIVALCTKKNLPDGMVADLLARCPFIPAAQP